MFTSDGHGDGEAMTFYEPDTSCGMKLLQSFEHQTSIGQFYSAITTFLGFRATRHEGKITGLAAYGKPTVLLDQFRVLFQFKNGKLTQFPFDEKETLWKKYNLDNELNLKTKINFHSESSIGVSYAHNARIFSAIATGSLEGTRNASFDSSTKKGTPPTFVETMTNPNAIPSMILTGVLSITGFESMKSVCYEQIQQTKVTISFGLSLL